MIVTSWTDLKTGHRWERRLSVLLVSLALTAAGGCTFISIDPTCPEELKVGESGEVAANPENEGAVPWYIWEVIPSDAGGFADGAAEVTTFQALKEGEATIRLTAGDGLFQMIAECTTQVVGVSDLAVSLSASPTILEVGRTTTLECTSVGETEATTLTVQQISGESDPLVEYLPGVYTSTTSAPGVRMYQCIGTTDEGVESEPAVVTVTVTEPPVDNANDNGAGNDNQNDNGAANDNGNDNAAGNDNANDNAAGNANDNENANDNGAGNDNANDNGNGASNPRIPPR